MLNNAGAVPFGEFSDDRDVDELRQKRTTKDDDVRPPKWGKKQAHRQKEQLTIQLGVETDHGLVCSKGMRCLPCNLCTNTADDVELSHKRHGWEHTIRATDFKTRWQRSDKNDFPKATHKSLNNIAYVRKIEFYKEDNDGVCDGSVSLVASNTSVAGSVVECSNGCAIISFNDIEKAHKMTSENKFQWFHQACQRLCRTNENEGQARIPISRNHLLADSIETVLSLSQSDLRKVWIIERKEEGDESIPLHEWYESIIEQLFCPDVGLWQNCDMDETRMEINFLSGVICPNHLRYFRFIGRILGKAVLDRQLLGCRLSQKIYKLLLGWPIASNDLNDKELCYLRSLEEMNGEEVGKLGLHFTVSEDHLGLRTRVPIVTNGFDIAVDEENLPEYIDSYLKYCMFGRCEKQLSEFILGFFEVVPDPLLTVFDFQELEELMCGSYTGGKTEEWGDNDGKQREELFMQEIMNNIFEMPENQSRTSTKQGNNSPPQSGGTTESASHLTFPRRKPPWPHPHEEKVEEEPPEDWKYPISDIPNTHGEIRQERRVLEDIPGGPPPGYLDAHFRYDENASVTRRVQSVCAENPLEARIREKQRADDALTRTNSVGRGVVLPPRVPSRLITDGRTHEGVTGSSHHPHMPPATMDAHVTLAPQRTESTSSSWSPIPVPDALLIEDETLYIAEPMDESISNDGSHALNSEERRLLIKRGCCPDCGMQTHKVSGVMGRFKKRYRPLHNQDVLNGRCLICNPKDVAVGDDRPHPSAPPFDMSLGSDMEENNPKEHHLVENEYFSSAQSHVEVEHWLLSRLPKLQRLDVEKYCDILASDGFDSLDMLDGVEEEDLKFMKKAHRRTLMKRL